LFFNSCSVFVSTAKRLRVMKSSELPHGIVSIVQIQAVFGFPGMEIQKLHLW
jgi:auxin-responsive protein IAA